MKKSTAFGAVLCSAALAVGMAMPAFAEVGAVESKDYVGNVTDGITSDSVVRVQGSEAAQIAATVPVLAVVSAPENGGAILGPKSEVYKITSNCDTPIVVQSVYGEKATGWEINTGSTALTPTTNTKTDAGLIRLTVQSTDATDVASVVKSNAASPTSLKASCWTMASKNASVMINLAGEAYPKKAETDAPANKISASGEDCVTLHYKIAVAE